MRRASFFALTALLYLGATVTAAPIKVLIITGDNVGAHNWQETTKALKDILTEKDHVSVDVTTTPGKDLTDENLAKYDVLLLNYFATAKGPADSKWSDANMKAFLKAVHDEGKGLVVYHFASAAFARPNNADYEKAIAGGWRTQGYHGPAHNFEVKKTDVKHPISAGLPAKFEHTTDELYSNSLMTPGSVVLATAFSDPKRHPADTNPKSVTSKDEAVIWVNQYGKGRVYNNVLGHDLTSLSDKNLQVWLRHGVEWAATGKVEAHSEGR